MSEHKHLPIPQLTFNTSGEPIIIPGTNCCVTCGEMIPDTQEILDEWNKNTEKISARSKSNLRRI